MEIGSEEKSEDARRLRKLGIDDYLKCVWDSLADRPEGDITDRYSPNEVGGDLLLLGNYLGKDGALHQYKDGDPRYRSAVLAEGLQLVAFRFKWWGARVTFRLEQHAEYVMLTSIIDLSRFKSKEDIAVLNRERYRGIYDAYVDLMQLDSKVSSSDYRKLGDTDYPRLYMGLYENIWTTFYEVVLRDARDQEPSLGKVFADFRGLALSSPIAPTDAKCESFQGPFWRKSDESQLSESDAIARRGGRRSLKGLFGGGEQKSNGEKKSRDWHPTIDKFWRFLTVNLEYKNFNLNFRDYEFTVSTMLDGRALYITSLGAQPPEIPEKRVPLYYFLFCDNISGWQIGRLIERLHHLGTVRLAAIVKLDRLRSVSYKLRYVEHQIRDALEKLERVTADHSEQEEEELNKGRLRALRDSINDVELELAEVNKNFRLAVGHDGEQFTEWDDIEYRIERSRYYMKQFHEGLDALRIERVECYQPYNIFVQRRLGVVFNFIDLLYDQYARVMQDKNDLFQFYLTQQAECARIETRNRNSEIVSIQTLADLALWFVLVPYYIGTLIIVHIWGHADTDPAGKMLWQELWGVCAFIGLCVHIRRQFKNKSLLSWLRRRKTRAIRGTEPSECD